MRKNLAIKLALLVVLAAAVGAFIFFDLGRYLNQETLEQVRGLYARNQYTVIVVYFLGYVAVTALSLPGALVMSLAGGALMGLGPGLAVISFASSIGATLAFLAARLLFGGWVQEKFGDRLGAVNRGIKEDGAFYLFTLRLAPIFPFFMVNLVMAMTPMRVWTFYWVSQLGMLPGTIVYVNAGAELGKISGVSGILSPSLIVSFVILGLFPITVKKLLAWHRIRSGRGKVSGS